MALGPGIYDDLCTEARQSAKAKGCILLIFEGSRGSGVSCQGSPEAYSALPDLLRMLADRIERERETLETGGKA